MIGILGKYALIVIIMYAAMFLTKTLVRWIFKIDQDNDDLHSQNYVKQRFEEVNAKFKNYSLVVLFIILVVNVAYFAESHYFIIAVFIYTFTRMLIKAYFERKYSKNPRQSILTFAEMFVLLAALIIILKFNLL